MDNTMLYVNGSEVAHRCECGANVFTKLSDTRYSCNGCGAEYSSGEVDTMAELDKQICDCLFEAREKYPLPTSLLVKAMKTLDAAYQQGYKAAMNDMIKWARDKG